jgi:integrase/recombinase XerD
MDNHYKILQKEYLHWLKILGFSNATVGICDNGITLFFEWLQQNNITHITHLENEHINHYFDYVQERPNQRRAGGLSHSYLNKQFEAVDKFLQFLHQNNYPKILPPTNFRIKKSKMEKVFSIEPFTQSEIKALIAHIPQCCEHLPYLQRERREQQLKLIFALYYGCGLRKKEGINLTLKEIDFDKKILFVKQGKNYKDRIIPLSNNIYNALQDYIYNFRSLQKTKHSRLFINPPETFIIWMKKLQRICPDENQKAKRISLHILRHSIATHLLQNGMSVEKIAKFLGHSSLTATQIYTHFI